MARGGRRKGEPGKPYPNRSDLRGPGTPDIPKNFTGQPYGAAQQQQQAQAAAPAGPPQGAPGPAAALGPPPVPAGSLGAFNRASERPGEPITAGLPSGPGPGPEALGLREQGNEEDVDLTAVARYLPTLELLASLPGASISTRNFVRRLRGSVPPSQMPRPDITTQP